MAEKDSTALWGGRFEAGLHPGIQEFTGSLAFDRRLARHDLVASLAHVRMLVEREVLSPDQGHPILTGLSGMLGDLESGRLAVEGDDEDVHTWIERTLGERIGDAARRVHTARSRNDQTSVALRLYVREALEGVLERLVALERALVATAAEHVESWLPGYTHLQRAQPVSLAHHLLAHVWALTQDAARLRAAHDAAGTSPLGAAALAGSTFDIDPARSAELCGLPRVFANSMHAVADRDYVLEAAFACAVLQVHLSRWAEEVVLWASREFGFLELDDSIAQGSSIMPQKKNPEAAEILRGKAARSIGHVSGLLALVKSLPLTYNSDLQEDKEALFDALDTAAASLSAALPIVQGSRYRLARMEESLTGGMITATELADHLVRRGVPFRTAHGQVGKAVRAAEERGLELWELPHELLRQHCPDAEGQVRESLLPGRAVQAHDSPGGPASKRVQTQLQAAHAELMAHVDWLGGISPAPIYRAHVEGTLLSEALE